MRSNVWIHKENEDTWRKLVASKGASAFVNQALKGEAVYTQRTQSPPEPDVSTHNIHTPKKQATFADKEIKTMFKKQPKEKQ